MNKRIFGNLLLLHLILAAVLPALSERAQSASAFQLEVTRVSDSVYVAVGATKPPGYENGGHNNNLSFVITAGGVLVVNGGDNYLLAEALHRQIKQRTVQPVKWVVNENGQGHAFLGNSYWATQQGVEIIAHEDAIAEMKLHGEVALRRMQELVREKADKTTISIPTKSFGAATNDRFLIELGGTRIELLRFGAAHSPGDISVWLPQDNILIAGDIAFHQRLLGIFPDTDVAGWIESFQRMTALQPKIIIPGHGAPTDVDTLNRETLGYLLYLRTEIERILDEDGDLSDAYSIDQSAYEYLDTFEELAAKNAGRLYQTMEMEYF
jgi:glyoxylase-like metal-dependent hydrolase (beta-lactamase superfamily II)